MRELRSALLMVAVLTLLCGGLYPALVTGLAQLLFPAQANGSLLRDKTGTIVGSALIGQDFSAPQYLWPRPSATAEFPYNPLASGGANAGPTNPAYLQTVAERLARLRAAGISGPVGSELVQASGSGLDPHISPPAAALQVSRIARTRALSQEQVAKVIGACTADRQFGLLGVPRVNVLAVNLELDRLHGPVQVPKR